MFRRLPTGLPPDPIVPADLERLGYFVNDNDQIRMIRNPDQKYQYKVNRNDRYNEVYKQAMNSCIRTIVHKRLQDLGLEIMRLPIGVMPDENHVPILVSKNLKNTKRVIVLFSERNQDLGIFSYRKTGEAGIKIGSAVELVDAILNGPIVKSSEEPPAVILTNPGQLIWYRGGGRAVGDLEWQSVPRASAVDEAFRMDAVKNTIPGNEDYGDHVRYVFETVLDQHVSKEAKLDLIGLEYTGTAMMLYLNDNWNIWSNRINGICLSNPQYVISELTDKTFIEFVQKRTRAYYVSDARLESTLPGREKTGCNCYASGEQYYEEGILIECWRSMLDWFNMVYTVQGYEEPLFTVVEDKGGSEMDQPGCVENDWRQGDNRTSEYYWLYAQMKMKGSLL